MTKSVNVILSEAKNPECAPKIRKRMNTYFVYIMTNKRNGTLYTGMTNDLERRVYEHKHKLVKGFTCRYGLNILVYFEDYNNVKDAIAREKQIKGWTRKKKLTLIETMNPEWKDLSKGWYE